jgi:hypothetical protein
MPTNLIFVTKSKCFNLLITEALEKMSQLNSIKVLHLFLRSDSKQ